MILKIVLKNVVIHRTISKLNITYIFNICNRRRMAEILPIRRKTLYNQSIITCMHNDKRYQMYALHPALEWFKLFV